MRDVDLAYLAGVIDADGYVTASAVTRKGRRYFGAQVGITGSSPEPHDLAAKLFGGRVLTHRPGGDRAHHLMQHHWQLCGNRAVPVIEAVLPYLRIKQERAELVLDLQQQLLELGGRRDSDDYAPWMYAGWDPEPMLQAMVDEIRACGKRGRRSVGELDGRTHDEYPAVSS